ncbi:hypothetical protein [Thermodesulforhabdus norvegica]|uniref:Outer membrane lipoprotein-sorting protein n=1 Tax=Thermodesulforhabdus norvegica TaxID=39841 RepID=A0A1I4QP89_9BACT|nr:hypothetical protein [Thermodesulforhabdus norvegica]SFM41864.1 hypothetical protein SAMN05660836_00147 [Thermodesulforhabdus norvegica]
MKLEDVCISGREIFSKSRRLCSFAAFALYLTGLISLILCLSSCTPGFVHLGGKLKKSGVATADRCALWEQYFCRLQGRVVVEGSERAFTLVIWSAPERIRVDVVSGWGGTVAVGIFDEKRDNLVWLPSRKEVYLSKDGSQLTKYLLGVEFPPQKIRELISGCGPDMGERRSGYEIRRLIIGEQKKVIVEYDPPFRFSDSGTYPQHILISTEEGSVRLDVETVELRSVETEVYKLSFPGDVKVFRL